MDARLKVRYSKVKLTQLTEADNGNFVITGSDGQNLNLFSLNVLGENFSLCIPFLSSVNLVSLNTLKLNLLESQ